MASNEASGARCEQLVNVCKGYKGILLFLTCLKLLKLKVSPKNLPGKAMYKLPVLKVLPQ